MHTCVRHQNAFSYWFPSGSAWEGVAPLYDLVSSVEENLQIEYCVLCLTEFYRWTGRRRYSLVHTVHESVKLAAFRRRDAGKTTSSSSRKRAFSRVD